MNETQRVALIAGGILLGLAGAAWWLFAPSAVPGDEPLAAAPAATAASALPAAAPAGPSEEPLPDRYALPAPATALALPPLADSDERFAAALAPLADASRLASVLVSEQGIRRLVATVDNLTRERLALNDRAFKRVPGEFMVKSRDGSYALSPANEARYVPMVSLANAVGAARAAELYLAHYPLFDQAYRELGRPDRKFNDRLVQVIDHLLATPEVEPAAELIRPKVFYQFADPTLEARSAGQKLFIRMGAVNRAQAKSWLRTFRAVITGGAAPR